MLCCGQKGPCSCPERTPENGKISSTARSWTGILGLTFGLVILQPDRAFAYIDPATGSYFLQWLLALLLAAAFGLKIFWRNVTGFIDRLFSRRRDSEHETEGDQKN